MKNCPPGREEVVDAFVKQQCETSCCDGRCYWLMADGAQCCVFVLAILFINCFLRKSKCDKRVLVLHNEEGSNSNYLPYVFIIH